MMELSSLFVPSVYLLICFLAYSSQVLFLYLEPHPLTQHESKVFNVLLVCLLICYTRSVYTDPGRFPTQAINEEAAQKDASDASRIVKNRQRWCRKCEAVKPPRAHHCKTCKRCVPKMDHHCPWTANCVSHTTFPHFIRFLFYAVISMSYLEYFLYERLAILWQNRNLPAYLGPNLPQLAHLFLLTATNSLTLFALTILLLRNIYSLSLNTTTIEGWEIERHATLVRRARHFGGSLDAPDGTRLPIRHQEFPYDIGILSNIAAGMATANPLAWFFPLSASPDIAGALDFPTNGFEDPGTTWPPPDPDRMARKLPKGMERDEGGDGFTYVDEGLSAADTREAFRRRQEEDVRRRRKFVRRVEEEMREANVDGVYGSESEEGGDGNESGEESWRNSEGERLGDFGLDEEAEFYEWEDDVPLSELIARRKLHAR